MERADAIAGTETVTEPSLVTGTPASEPSVPAAAVASAIARRGTGGGEERKRTTPTRHVTPMRARPESARPSVIALQLYLRRRPCYEEPSYELRLGGVHGNRRGVRLPGERPEPAHPTRS